VASVTVKHGLLGDTEHGVTVIPVVSTVTLVVLKFADTLLDMKPVPVRVTVLPPTVGPVPGATLVTVGTGAYAYVSFEDIRLVCVEVPSVDWVVTVMSTCPLPAGGVAVINDGLVTVKAVAAVAPNETALVVNPDPLKSVPWIVTVGGPPAVEPV